MSTYGDGLDLVSDPNCGIEITLPVTPIEKAEEAQSQEVDDKDKYPKVTHDSGPSPQRVDKVINRRDEQEYDR